VNNAMHRLLPRYHGFTLIELVVVIFIIAVVSGILLLHMPSVQHARIQAQVANIMSTFRLAHEYAISHNQFVKLSIAPERMQFFVHTQSDPEFIPLGDSQSFWQIPAQSGYTYSVKQPPLFPADNGTIFFWPTGEITPFTLSLNRGADRYFIKINDQGIVQAHAGDIA
jgi:type II secretion system protein H